MEVNHQSVHNKEKIYFALVLILSILCYFFLVVSVIGIAIIAFIIIFSLFFHFLAMAGIRRNGIRLSEKQFPELYSKAVVVAKNMQLANVPDIYVMESEGVLNAFATKFIRRNMVVLSSSIFDMIEREAEEEVLFVLAHEFTHLKRNHILIQMFILPALWIPFLGNAYSRACEYTCDRNATLYIQSPEAAKSALTILGIGTNLYKKVNKQAFMEQLETESGFFVWFHEKLSTHPHLPKRIYAIETYFNPETEQTLKESKKGVWIGVSVLFLAFILLIGLIFGATFALERLGEKVGHLWTEDMDAYSMESTYDTFYEDMDYTEYVENGSVNTLSVDGQSPLHIAVQTNDYNNVKYLLENEADPNLVDDFGDTPIMAYAYQDVYVETEIIQLLLDYGADPTIEDVEGNTVLDYAYLFDDQEVIEILQSYNTPY